MNLRSRMAIFFSNEGNAEKLVEKLQDPEVVAFNADEHLQVTKDEDTNTAVIKDKVTGEEAEVSFNEDTNELDIQEKSPEQVNFSARAYTIENLYGKDGEEAEMKKDWDKAVKALKVNSVSDLRQAELHDEYQPIAKLGMNKVKNGDVFVIEVWGTKFAVIRKDEAINLDDYYDMLDSKLNKQHTKHSNVTFYDAESSEEYKLTSNYGKMSEDQAGKQANKDFAKAIKGLKANDQSEVRAMYIHYEWTDPAELKEGLVKTKSGEGYILDNEGDMYFVFRAGEQNVLEEWINKMESTGKASKTGSRSVMNHSNVRFYDAEGNEVPVEQVIEEGEKENKPEVKVVMNSKKFSRVSFYDADEAPKAEDNKDAKLKEILASKGVQNVDEVIASLKEAKLFSANEARYFVACIMRSGKHESLIVKGASIEDVLDTIAENANIQEVVAVVKEGTIKVHPKLAQFSNKEVDVVEGEEPEVKGFDSDEEDDDDDDDKKETPKAEGKDKKVEEVEPAKEGEAKPEDKSEAPQSEVKVEAQPEETEANSLLELAKKQNEQNKK